MLRFQCFRSCDALMIVMKYIKNQEGMRDGAKEGCIIITVDLMAYAKCKAPTFSEARRMQSQYNLLRSRLRLNLITVEVMTAINTKLTLYRHHQLMLLSLMPKISHRY